MGIFVGPQSDLNLSVCLLAFIRGWWSRKGYYGAYLLSCRPSFVITAEDNAVEFFFTKQYLPEARTLCLQNGRRDTFSHDSKKTLWDILRNELPSSATPDIILAHGRPSEIYFREALTSSATRIIRAGNISNNAFGIDGIGADQRVLLISSFPNLGDDGDLKQSTNELLGYWQGAPVTLGQYFTAEGVVARLVADYAELHGLQFGVVGKRPSRQSGEFRYFKAELGGRAWTYLPCEEKGASYGVITPRDVLVNIDSTFGYEMMARGVRVAFVAARMPLAGYPEIRDSDFAYPFITTPKGPFWTNDASKDEVFRVIDAVRNGSNSEWCAAAGIELSEVFVYDRGNTILCGVLDELGIQNSGPQLLK